MLCYSTTSKHALDYLPLELTIGDMDSILSYVIRTTQGADRVFTRYEEFTHAFSYLDDLLPGLRAFHVWSTSAHCPHQRRCEWFDQVYRHHNHVVVLRASDINLIHFREVLGLFRQKEGESSLRLSPPFLAA